MSLFARRLSQNIRGAARNNVVGVRKFHPLAAHMGASMQDTTTGGLVPMVIEQTVRVNVTSSEL